MSELAELLQVALRASDTADAISLSGFTSRSFGVSRKADNSEVTDIDRATEQAIVASLTSARPDYGIYGEEFGTSGPANAEATWVIDPIDGTTNFVRGVPVWATLIALVRNGVPELGVVSAPAMGFRWWATKGDGAFFNGTRISASSTATISSPRSTSRPRSMSPASSASVPCWWKPVPGTGSAAGCWPMCRYRAMRR